MKETIAKIEGTFLGFEDHGIFTFVLDLSYGGSNQGAGTYDIRGPECAEMLQSVLKACGVDRWEKLKGRTILALHNDDDGYHSPVRGIAPLPTERGEPFIFDSVFAQA